MEKIGRDELAELRHDRKMAGVFEARLRRIERLVDRWRLMTPQELHDRVMDAVTGRDDPREER